MTLNVSLAVWKMSCILSRIWIINFDFNIVMTCMTLCLVLMRQTTDKPIKHQMEISWHQVLASSTIQKHIKQKRISTLFDNKMDIQNIVALHIVVKWPLLCDCGTTIRRSSTSKVYSNATSTVTRHSPSPGCVAHCNFCHRIEMASNSVNSTTIDSDVVETAGRNEQEKKRVNQIVDIWFFFLFFKMKNTNRNNVQTAAERNQIEWFTFQQLRLWLWVSSE